MRLAEIRGLLDEACEFPIDHDELVERYGAVELDAPNGEAITLATALERAPEARYGTADAAYATVAANVGDPYIGRKRYDDRSTASTAREILSF